MNPNTASWQPQSPLITDADLPQILKQHRIVVVHCGAVWNGSDITLDNTIQEVRRKFAPEVGFYALDIDLDLATGRRFCDRYGFMNIPACVCFVHGVFQGMFIGALPSAGVIRKLQTLVGVASASETMAEVLQTWPVSLMGWSYLRSERIAQFAAIQHGVTLRHGYTNEFNLSFSVTEDWDMVRRNRDSVCSAMHFKPAQLIVPAQTHGANVTVVGMEDAGRGALAPDTAIPDCDALITNTPGLLLGITIADCLPIFFLDPVHNAIGLAHSGWRGTAGRIAVNTLQTMTARFGTNPVDCLAAIGPGIGPEGYEVDRRVYDGFTRSDAQVEGVFTPTRPGHWRLDLYAAVTHQLRQAGVPAPNFDICPYRTDRDTTLFFSHRLVPGCGRMGAFLGLRGSE